MLLNPYRFVVAGGGGGGGATDPDWASVAALLHFDGANGSTTFTDEKGATWSTTGTPTISTAQSVFGGSSIRLANNSLLTSPSSTLYGVGTNLTVEFWIRPDSVSALGGLFSMYNGTNGIYAYINSGGIDWTNGGGTGSTSGLSAGVWSHVAFVKQGSAWRVYLNGVLGSTLNSAASATSARSIRIGADPNVVGGTGGMAGYMDDFRVTATARYSANFTPPAAPFPNS